MAIFAETSNYSFPNYYNTTVHLYECYDVSYEKKIGTALATMSFLVGLPLNAWLLLLFAKGLWVSMVAFDIFLFNATFIQALYCLANPVMTLSAYIPNNSIMIITLFATGVMQVGWSLFQSCTCVMRYLAVVYPIVFLKIRAPKYLKYHVMCSVTIWLVTLSFCLMLVMMIPEFPVQVLSMPFTLVLVINTFCSLSIMRALRRPAPGDSEREGMHNMNRLAFRRVQITHLLVTLNYSPYVCAGILKSQGFSSGQVCIAYAFSYVSIAVTNIVQPLLSLSRMGKLPSCQVCPSMNQEQTG